MNLFLIYSIVVAGSWGLPSVNNEVRSYDFFKPGIFKLDLTLITSFWTNVWLKKLFEEIITFNNWMVKLILKFLNIISEIFVTNQTPNLKNNGWKDYIWKGQFISKESKTLTKKCFYSLFPKGSQNRATNLQKNWYWNNCLFTSRKHQNLEVTKLMNVFKENTVCG